MKTYQPSQKTLEKYADVLVNFALGGGTGIRKGEVVRLNSGEFAKPLYMEIRKAVIKAGGHVLSNYQPDNGPEYYPSRDFFENADDDQLDYLPKKYLRGLVDEIDHSISIISDVDKQALMGVEPKKLMQRGLAFKPVSEWLNEKENKGKYTWTLALYGTPAGAKEAGLSYKDYWDQIIKACYLDKKNPINEWKKVTKRIEATKTKLNKLKKVDYFHVVGPDVDLKIKLGEKRKWMGGSGRNIPSFELFCSPDWRGTEGWIKFNQPLYRYGNLIKNVKLVFKKGKVIEASASKNEKVLKEMIATKNADKVGEFSLTDKRTSRITKFMAETLFDENVGGPYGNTHIALGNAYKDGYDGNPARLKKIEWRKLGFNESSVHTDIVSTTKRTVEAYFTNGKSMLIYKDGKFTL